MNKRKLISAVTILSLTMMTGYVDCGIAYECSCGPYGGSSETICWAGLGMADELDMMNCEPNAGAYMDKCATIIGFIYLGDEDVEKVKYYCYCE